MARAKDSDSADIGDVVGDLNDGWEAVWMQVNRIFDGWEVISTNVYHLSGGAALIRQNTGVEYLNKTLVVLSEKSTGTIVLAASQDDRLLVFVEVKPI